MGHREPLNAAERFKKDDDGLHVRERIVNRYAHLGFDSIDPADLRGRFRWWGLYTQRRPGIGGGKTGALEDEEIEAPYFMMRVRIPGGQLSASQLRTVAGIAKEYGRDLADITDRQNVQYHWLSIEDVPAIWQRLEAVGLSSLQACGDVPRNILGCPVAGLDASEILDASEVLRATEEVATTQPGFTNLPRKYKTTISGCTALCTAHEVNDISFVGVTGPGGTPGFDLWVGGGLSTNPMLAQRLGVFVEPDQVPAVWAGVTGLFRDYGYRRLRSRARLKFLVADWGTQRFREVLEKEYLAGSLPDGPAPVIPAAGDRDHIGVHQQRDGRYYLGVAPSVGRTSGTLLWQVADLAEAYGSGRVRTTTQQKLLILDVPEDKVGELSEELAARDLLVAPVGVPARHHGLHRDRVLQARDRGDKAAGRRPVRGAGTPAARLRHPDQHQRQRLPQLVCPVPGRRHRAQGLDHRRRRGVPGAPGRLARHRPGIRPQAARPEGDRGRAAGLLRAGAAQLPVRPGRRRAVRDLGPPRRREPAGMSTPGQHVPEGRHRGAPGGRSPGPARAAGAVLLPVLRGRGPAAGPAGGSWRCGACARSFELRFAGLSPGGHTGTAPAVDRTPP